MVDLGRGGKPLLSVQVFSHQVVCHTGPVFGGLFLVDTTPCKWYSYSENELVQIMSKETSQSDYDVYTYSISLNEREWEDLRILLYETLKTMDRSVQELQQVYEMDENMDPSMIPQEITEKKSLLGSFLDQTGYPQSAYQEEEEEIESEE